MLILPLAMENSFTVWTNHFILVHSWSYVKQNHYLIMHNEYATWTENKLCIYDIN